MMIDGITLDPQSQVPLHRQLYTSLREMILQGVLPGDARMPSSRALAERLCVSRFTTVTALDQLVAEGYLRAVHGSGTFVETIPGSTNHNAAEPQDIGANIVTGETGSALSRLANAITWRNSISTNRRARYLHMSAPDHRLFPHLVWAKLTRDLFPKLDSAILCYRDTDEPSFLEQQIASQVAVSRGIRCDPEEVVTTLGAHHAASLLSDLLLDPEDTVAVEEPGMQAICSMFLSHGCKVLPLPVDENGANPAGLPKTEIKLAFVTAAKQQPLTIAMPVKRKLEVLNWATENNVIIVEDDLGSEFRYEGRPIPPLKALDHSKQVIYVGAFSMSLLQTMRVGYMIMPRQLATMCRRLIQVRYRATAQINEQLLAHFIADGHYARHLHKARRIYARRQERLLEILNADFTDIFEPPGRAAGFYNLCYFSDDRADDTKILVRCNERGLGVEQLSYYYRSGKSPRKALLIGFAASNEEEIETGMSLLRECM